MAEAGRRFIFGKRRAQICTAAEEERQGLLDSLAQTRTYIQQAYTAFNGTDDPDLIDSYVFEINALQSRYSYLLRRIKAVEADLKTAPDEKTAQAREEARPV